MKNTAQNVVLTARKAGKNIVYTVTVDGVQIATRRGHVAYRACRVWNGTVSGYHKTLAAAEKAVRAEVADITKRAGTNYAQTGAYAVPSTVVTIDEAGEAALAAIEAGWQAECDEQQAEIAREMEEKGLTRSEAVHAIVARS